jgi:hypothetical protein
MRHDNEVKGSRSFSSHVSSLRARLMDTPRRAAAFGLAAAVASGALMMSTTHTSATNADLAKAAIITNTVADVSIKDKNAAASRSSRSSERSASPAKAATAKAKGPLKPAAAHKAHVEHTNAMLRTRPVAGLNDLQMRNAALIVIAGQELHISRRGQIVAVATAMQESNLYNLASYVVPESLRYAHQGTGADFDSVGLFQQRYTTGWGTVKSIMNPKESAKKFYRALMQVPGWQRLPITVAAQTVQGSAFPDAYAQHTGRATSVVNAVNHGR